MAGKEGKGIGKVGRPSGDVKQRRLTVEGKEGKEGKKVTFKLSEENMDKEEKKRISEICKKIVGVELGVLEEERKKEREELRGLKERMTVYEERLGKIEAKLEEIGKWINEKEEEAVGVEKEKFSVETEGGSGSIGDGRTSRGTRSEGEISTGSCLSTREVDRIRRWVTEKDREERRRNIILKGIRPPKEIEKDRKKVSEWIEKLFREKMGVDINVQGCRESGTVIVAKLESEEEKREVMRNKYKLKGGNIFIENDLSWEERNIQVKINRWVREQKVKGLEVKIGIGRVRVKGVWRAWAEIEREGLAEERGEERREERDGYGTSQDMQDF